ncbi:emp24 gp25l p24 family protein [Stylonychia lemnae]|uniref:Emp24 gp25l p24 family protein n=1 Tax=Stylonychia lemnae TaxID=5949 RepID=A0A078AUJ4_STYLE|nr:emp24 gp25l p24 family protein [Stylonychia lemnae]|eukprot:CDW84548.1 emp24 gp25l p24 family protein [Stylonychia lemnae]
MQKGRPFKSIAENVRKSLEQFKGKEIIEENKQEAVRFFEQTSEKLNMLLLNVNETFEFDIKQRLMETLGKDFGQEAVLNRFDDFIVYLNRITSGPVKRFLGIHEFDRQVMKDSFKYNFSQYGSKQIFYNELLNQKDEGGTNDAHVNFQISGKIDLHQSAKDKFILTVTIGDYIQYMTKGTKEVTRKKLQHFMQAIKTVLEKVVGINGKYKPTQVSYSLKGLIYFKKEDLLKSKVQITLRYSPYICSSQYKQHLVLGLIVLCINTVKLQDISEEEVKVIEENVEGTQKKEDTTEDDHIMREWEKLMVDFIPEFNVGFKLQAKQEQSYYEDIEQGQTVLARGVYFARGADKEKGVIDFFVLDPKRQVIYSRRKKSEGVFSLTLTTPGQYTFIFSNLKQKQPKEVQFYIQTQGNDEGKVVEQVNTGTSTDQNQAETTQQDYINLQNILYDEAEQIVEFEHLRNLTDDIVKIQMQLTSVQIEQRVSNKRLEHSNEHIEANSKYSFYVSLVEGLIFVAIASYQVYYIKNLVENKRLLI